MRTSDNVTTILAETGTHRVSFDPAEKAIYMEVKSFDTQGDPHWRFSAVWTEPDFRTSFHLSELGSEKWKAFEALTVLAEALVAANKSEVTQ